MKITVTAEVGKAYAPFLHRALHTAFSRGMGFQPVSGNPKHGLKTCATQLALSLQEASCVLVDDRRMATLHKTFMNIAGATDVLTFPIDVDANGNVLSGEIYICLSQARRQAKIHAIDLKVELLLYAIHGMLHLRGYDDRTARAYRQMHQLEDRILTQLGFGPVFFGSNRRRKGART